MEEIARYVDADTPLTKEEIALFGSLIMGNEDNTQSNKEITCKIDEISKNVAMARREITDHIATNAKSIIRSNNDCTARIIESNNSLIAAINNASEKLVLASEKSLGVNSAGFISLIKAFHEINDSRNSSVSCAIDTLLKYANGPEPTTLQNINSESSCIIKSKKGSKNKYHSCPREIRDIIGKMSKSGNPCGTHFGKARKMLTSSGVDTNKLIKKVSRKYKLNSNCNVWFAIAEYPDIVKKLDSLVSDSLSWRF